jgi:hypothetical protein
MKRILTLLALNACLHAHGAGRHLIVAYAPSLPESTRNELANLTGTALYQSEPGTRITVVRTDPLATIVEATVPEGAPVLRQRRAGPSIARLARELSVATNSTGQFLLPSVMDAIGRQWTSQNDTVLLVGPALHTDARQPEFNFTTNWPSDGHLTAPAGRSPFSTVDRRHLLDGVGVYWIVTDMDRMANSRQAEAIRRFWTLYLGLQGGTLLNFSPDASSTIANAMAGRLSTGSVPTVDLHDTSVSMLPSRIAEPSPAAPVPAVVRVFITNVVEEVHVVTITNEIEVVRQTALPRVAQGNSGIGIVWSSGTRGAQGLDLDLYVWVPKDSTELFYGKTMSATGRYFRDVRQSAESASTDWRGTYEFVELQGDQLPPEVWINVFAGKGPAQGELRIQHQGREHRVAFAIPSVRGNGGRDRASRSTSEHWLRIDLRSVLEGR